MAGMDIEMASPVGPVVAPGYSQAHEFGIPTYQPEIDLCRLLQAMSLTKGKLKVHEPETTHVLFASQSANEHDANTEDPAYHSDASASSSSKSNFFDQPHTDTLPIPSTIACSFQLPGCHFLQSILASLDPGSLALSPSPYPYPAVNAFPTTNGAYLDTLLLHRNLLSTFPAAHKGCATTLHEIARAVERRAWQADRDSDAEAIIALRQEAYLVAHWV